MSYTHRTRILPEPYPELIIKARSNILSQYRDNIECLALCGGCSRGNILQGYSDIDLFAISRKGKVEKERYVSKGVKISLETIDIKDVLQEKFDTKVLYFLRSIKSEKALILYGNNKSIPNFPFSLLQDKASSAENIKFLFEVCAHDYASFCDEPTNHNSFLLVKHAHTMMKNLLRKDGYDYDGYEEVNNGFYRVYKTSQEHKIPTPEQLFNSNFNREKLPSITTSFILQCKNI